MTVTRAAIIAHTIWTAALCHSFRRGSLPHARFDAASDLEVYSLLKAEKVNMAIKPDYADRFPKHLTVEEIFKALPETVTERSPDVDVHLYLAGQVNLPELPKNVELEEKKEKKKTEQSLPGGGNGKGEGQQLDGDQQMGNVASQDASDSGDEQQDGQGNGQGAKSSRRTPGPGDSQESSQNTAEATGDASSKQEDGNASSDEPQEVDAAVDASCDPMMREVWRQRILETAQNYEMMHGVLPGDIAEIVQQFRESKIDYMQKLRRYLTLRSGGGGQVAATSQAFCLAEDVSAKSQQ